VASSFSAFTFGLGQNGAAWQSMPSQEQICGHIFSASLQHFGGVPGYILLNDFMLTKQGEQKILRTYFPTLKGNCNVGGIPRKTMIVQNS